MANQQKTEERKQQILDAFARLLSTHSFNQITMRAIAEEADLYGNALYYYFTNKDDILLSYARNTTHLVLEAVTNSLKTLPDERLKEMNINQIVGYSFYKVHLTGDYDYNGSAYLNTIALAINNPALKNLIIEENNLFYDGLETFFKEKCTSLRNPKVAARLFSSMFFGLLSYKDCFGNDLPVSHLIHFLDDGKNLEGLCWLAKS